MTLTKTIARVEAAARRHVRTLSRGANVFSFGAVDLDPANLAIWITTDTDRDRDRLARDRALPDRLRELLVSEGYPADAAPRVGFAFESEETVRRDFGGDWWHAVK